MNSHFQLVAQKTEVRERNWQRLIENSTREKPFENILLVYKYEKWNFRTSSRFLVKAEGNQHEIKILHKESKETNSWEEYYGYREEYRDDFPEIPLYVLRKLSDSDQSKVSGTYIRKWQKHESRKSSSKPIKLEKLTS